MDRGAPYHLKDHPQSDLHSFDSLGRAGGRFAFVESGLAGAHRSGGLRVGVDQFSFRGSTIPGWSLSGVGVVRINLRCTADARYVHIRPVRGE
jgi:hypothetical protein